MTITLTLPYPPPLDMLYATVRTKRGTLIRVLSKRGKQFKADTETICLAQRVKPITGDVKVVFRAYRPKRIGDLDGLFKIVFDALKGYAYIDDKQIVKIEADRYDDKLAPRVELEITEV